MPMKKFINDPENLTAELLDCYVKAYSNKVALRRKNETTHCHHRYW